MAQSKDYPTIKRLRGKVMVPRGITPFESAEDGTFYSYDELWIADAGHDVSTLEGCQAVFFGLADEKKRSLLEGGFELNGFTYDSDANAERRYMQLGGKFQSNPAHIQRWKASGDTWVNMDAALFQQLSAAGEAHINSVYAWLEAKQVEIKAAESIHQLMEVEI